MNKTKDTKVTFTNGVTQDYEQLIQRIGIGEFKSIVIAFNKWICDTATYIEVIQHTVKGRYSRKYGNGCAVTTWEANYPNDTQEQFAIFFMKYLAEHNMELKLAA